MVKKLGHIVFVFVVLFSSTGLVINQHYCKSELKSSALFISAQNCHDAKKKFCPNHQQKKSELTEEKSKNNCCDDESEYISLDQEQVMPSQFYYINIHFLVAFALNFSSLNNSRQLVIDHPYERYKPPPIFEDLVISHRSILC